MSFNEIVHLRYFGMLIVALYYIKDLNFNNYDFRAMDFDYLLIRGGFASLRGVDHYCHIDLLFVTP